MNSTIENVNTGVYANNKLEIAISRFFKLVHYKSESKYGCKLYKDNKLIAIVERELQDKVKAKFAFINSRNSKISNDDELNELLNQEFKNINLENMFLKDTILLNEDIDELPKVSEVGIEKCLKIWTLGIQFHQSESQLSFIMQTTSLNYVFIVEKDNIYCGISINIPFKKGLFGAGQYFRIRDFQDNSLSFCWWICDLGNKLESIDFNKDVEEIGQCIMSKEGIYWLVKEYSEDEIILQGCNGDEYKYTRNKKLVEYFK